MYHNTARCTSDFPQLDGMKPVRCARRAGHGPERGWTVNMHFNTRERRQWTDEDLARIAVRRDQHL